MPPLSTRNDIVVVVVLNETVVFLLRQKSLKANACYVTYSSSCVMRVSLHQNELNINGIEFSVYDEVLLAYSFGKDYSNRCQDVVNYLIIVLCL